MMCQRIPVYIDVAIIRKYGYAKTTNRTRGYRFSLKNLGDIIDEVRKIKKQAAVPGTNPGYCS